MAIAPVRVAIVGQDKTGAAFASVQKNLGGLKGQLGGIAQLLGVTFGAKAVRDQVEYADALGKTARQLGGTVEFLSETAAAAKLAGVETTTLTTGLQRMTRRIAEAAAGSTEFGKAFEALGLNARTLKNQSLEQQFEAILTAMRGVNNEAERVRIAQKIFDSEGVTIARLADNFAELRSQARDAGATITTLFANQAATINDTITVGIEKLNAALRGSVSFVFQFAEGLGIAAARLAGFEDGAVGALNKAISDTEAKLKDLRAGLEFTSERAAAGFPNAAAQVEVYRTEIERLQKTLAGYKRDLDELLEGGGFSRDPTPVNVRLAGSGGGGAETDKDRTDALLPKQIERAFLAATRGLEQVSTQTDETFTNIREEAAETSDTLERDFQAWTDAAIDGIDSLETFFIQSLKRMASQALSSGLLSLFGGSFLGFKFGGGRARGGPVSAGTGYLVGEKGPEYFIPGSSGRIQPATKTGGTIQVNNSIDARGADPSVIQALPDLLEATRQRTRDDILRLIRERRVNI